MDRQTIFQWVRKQYGTTPDYPWSDDNAVLRHKDSRRWYAVILEVKRSRLGLTEGDAPDEGIVDVINVKCDPALTGSLQKKSGFHPAYHMNKEQWISIRLDGSAGEEEIKNLIHLSFQLTGEKKRKNPENN